MGLCDGKVALVTGGSRGIGRAIALELAAQGASVALCARNVAAAHEVEEEIAARGGKALAQEADVADAAQVVALVKNTLDGLGGLDILVNNAGITRDNLLLRMKEEDWDAVMDINLKGAFNCCKAAVRPMLKARGGRIINIASVVGLSGNAGQANYHGQRRGSRTRSGDGHDGRFVRGSESTHAVAGAPRSGRNARGRGPRRGLSGVRTGGLCDRPGAPGGWRHGDVEDIFPKILLTNITHCLRRD